MGGSMHRIIPRTIALQKAQRNHAVLFRTRITTLWRTEIHIDLLIDADSLNRRLRHMCPSYNMLYLPGTRKAVY